MLELESWLPYNPRQAERAVEYHSEEWCPDDVFHLALKSEGQGSAEGSLEGKIRDGFPEKNIPGERRSNSSCTDLH